MTKISNFQEPQSVSGIMESVPATKVQTEKPLMSSSSKAIFISFIENKSDVSNSNKNMTSLRFGIIHSSQVNSVDCAVTSPILPLSIG